MQESSHIFLEKLWWCVISTLVLLASLLLFSRLLPASSSVGNAAKVYSGSNVLTNAVTMTADKLTEAMVSTRQAIDSGRQSAETTISRSSRSTAHGLRGGAVFVARTVGDSVAFIVHAPSTVLNFVTDTPKVSALIRPAEDVPTPKIDPAIPDAIAARTTLPVVKTVTKVAPLIDSTPTWPIHGAVTTLFGVPHWPYQPTHTGLDISDGQPAGTTPVKSFKPGRVLEVVHSSSGFGNHVIIDHGQGLTSLYGHLYSTSVQVGQVVDQSTTLGFEGSTGASTGTHLHFEIRLNGQPMNPYQFVNGQP